MSINYTPISNLKQLKVTTERVKVLKVVAEDVGQVVLKKKSR